MQVQIHFYLHNAYIFRKHTHMQAYMQMYMYRRPKFQQLLNMHLQRPICAGYWSVKSQSALCVERT